MVEKERIGFKKLGGRIRRILEVIEDFENNVVLNIEVELEIGEEIEKIGELMSVEGEKIGIKFGEEKIREEEIIEEGEIGYIEEIVNGVRLKGEKEDGLIDIDDEGEMRKN